MIHRCKIYFIYLIYLIYFIYLIYLYDTQVQDAEMVFKANPTEETGEQLRQVKTQNKHENQNEY